MPELTAITIYPDGNYDHRRADLTLEFMQGRVGGLIELIASDDAFDAFGNEEGKLLGLAWNPAATFILEQFGYELQSDVLVGPVMFVGPPDRDGGHLDLPKGVADRILMLAAVLLPKVQAAPTQKVSAMVDDLVRKMVGLPPADHMADDPDRL